MQMVPQLPLIPQDPVTTEKLEGTQKTSSEAKYENFTAPQATSPLDSIFNRLQKIVSQLAILGENISQEDLNLKFLRSLSSEWNTHVVVKGTTSSSSSLSSQNMAFVSSSSSTNEVNTAYGVSTANTQVSPASTQVSTTSTQLDMTSLRWTVSTAHRWDTLQGNTEDLGTKITGTGIKTALEGLYIVDGRCPSKPGLLMAFQTLRSFDHVQDNCNYHQRERVVSENNYTRVNYNYSAKKAHPSAHRNIVPRAVLMKTGLRSLNTARHVHNAHPKTTVYSARPMPKAVNTARTNSTVVNDVRANQVNAIKASGRFQKKKIKASDSDAQGHMNRDLSYLSDFRNLLEDLLPFDLSFNLFSVSQMCDKKNNVLFTDTGCFVLSPDSKLADESQVLLKVPRKNNMYSVDMKNIVPKRVKLSSCNATL
ncbi:hypothetical protein Tco_0887403 [Tanacetum coccineum]